MVAARHLKLFGFEPTIYYPKKSKNELYERLQTQLRNLSIRFIEDADIESEFSTTHHIIDAIFGFSFKPPIREPFPRVIELLKEVKVAVTSVDIPSSWDVDNGPRTPDDFHPTALVSLTAPKPASKYFKGNHFLGGRFVGQKFAEKYNIDIPEYPGVDQVVQIDSVI